MEAVSSPMVAAVKLPVLNPGEFELWKMRIEQYFLMTDYALWEVIVNGDSPPPKRTVDGVEQTYPPTTAEEKLARKNELKARAARVLPEMVVVAVKLLSQNRILQYITNWSKTSKKGISAIGDIKDYIGIRCNNKKQKDRGHLLITGISLIGLLCKTADFMCFAERGFRLSDFVAVDGIGCIYGIYVVISITRCEVRDVIAIITPSEDYAAGRGKSATSTFSIKNSTTYSPRGELISKFSSLTSVVGKGVLTGISHSKLLSDVTSDSRGNQDSHQPSRLGGSWDRKLCLHFRKEMKEKFRSQKDQSGKENH
ncbi:hypothetical protein Tco_0098374 [Tanacetum coccineum]